jgi:hypothetical protein
MAPLVGHCAANFKKEIFLNYNIIYSFSFVITLTSILLISLPMPTYSPCFILFLLEFSL